MKRLKIAILTLSILLLSTIAFSFEEVKILDWTPTDYENITVTTAAVNRLTVAKITDDVGAVFITVETNNLRYRIDGGNPNATVGHLLVSGSYQNLWLNNVSAIKNLRMIAIDGSSFVKVTYYKR